MATCLEKKILLIRRSAGFCYYLLESGDTIPIQKTKTNWIMSPVSLAPPKGVSGGTEVPVPGATSFNL